MPLQYNTHRLETIVNFLTSLTLLITIIVSSVAACNNILSTNHSTEVLHISSTRVLRRLIVISLLSFTVQVLLLFWAAEDFITPVDLITELLIMFQTLYITSLLLVISTLLIISIYVHLFLVYNLFPVFVLLLIILEHAPIQSYRIVPWLYHDFSTMNGCWFGIINIVQNVSVPVDCSFLSLARILFFLVKVLSER